MNQKKITATEIAFREDLYPRFEPNQVQIQKYSESIEFLPPIKINQNNILIDGFHRWKAHLIAGIQEIPFEVIETDSEKELKMLAYKMNSHHGLQLKSDEKKRFAVEMIEEQSMDEIAIILSVSVATITGWTKDKRDALKEQRDIDIVNMYLKAENTMESIAKEFNVTQPLIQNIIKNNKTVNNYNLLNPLLYNIWNTPKQDNDRKHFGAFPEIFMENLLYYHTKPLDIIYDPFGGGGTTADICKRMFRRYYVSDRKVVPGREKDIKQWDIKNGLPDDLQKPKLAFLDPPYWKQAEGKYSDDNEDLGNMNIEQFNNSMGYLLSELTKRKVERIAIVIQPTQYKNNFEWIDHVFDFDRMLNKYEIEIRYILPYSSQQYNAQMVDRAKEEKKCLALHRDLIIWRKLS